MPSSLPINISLWDFSLHYYARNGVSHLCLNLQDGYGINVNLLLWALWLGFRGKKLDAGLLVLAQKEIHSWHQHYVSPLRQLRRQMKVEFGVGDKSIETVRAQIKDAELLAEKHEQQLLEYLSGEYSEASMDRSSLMTENVRLYLGVSGVDEDFCEQLLLLVS